MGQRSSSRRVASDSRIVIVAPVVPCYEVRMHMGHLRCTEVQGEQAFEGRGVALAGHLVAATDLP